MIQEILTGTKEVIVELSCGMKENCSTLYTDINTCLDDLNVKMMGSYQEIEAHEKQKTAALEVKSEQSA